MAAFIIPAAASAAAVVARTAAAVVLPVIRFVGGSLVRGIVGEALSPGPSIRGALEIKIETDFAATAEFVGGIGKQVRYAAAVALTRTARRLVPLMEQEVARVFDKPVPFTRRAFGATMADKSSLTSTVYIRDKQAEYLRPQIEGGRRGRKPFEVRLARDAGTSAFWAPASGVRLNVAGNLTLKQIQEIAQKLRATKRFAEVFVGVPRGHPGAPFGIWERGRKGRGKNQRGAIRPLLVRISEPFYKPRFGFRDVAQRHAQRIFNEEFSRAFEMAMRTARPSSSAMQTIVRKVIAF